MQHDGYLCTNFTSVPLFQSGFENDILPCEDILQHNYIYIFYAKFTCMYSNAEFELIIWLVTDFERQDSVQ